MADPVNPFGKARSFIVPRERQTGGKPDISSTSPFKPAPVGEMPWKAPSGLPSPAPRADGFEKADGASSGTGGPGRVPATPHLMYMGGRVLDQPKVVNVFVGDYWNTAAGKGDAAHMDGFVKTLGGSGLYDMLSSEYNVGRPAFAGRVVIPGAVTKFGPDEIAAAVKQAVASGQIQGSDSQTIYAVQLPPQAVLTDGNADSSQGLGGFHGSIPGADGKQVLFSTIAYCDQANGINFNGNSRDNNTVTLSHELAETITDPDVAIAQTWGQIGFYDWLGGEIGDLAVNDGAVPLSEAFARNKDGYAVQIEWSNKDGMFEIDQARKPKIITQMAQGPVATKLSSDEVQVPLQFTKDMDITKVLLNLSLINSSGHAPQVTLTSPSGRSFPVPVPAVANFNGPLDITEFGAQGQSSKGTWFLSVTDPSDSGLVLSSVSMTAKGTSKEQPSAEAP